VTQQRVQVKALQAFTSEVLVPPAASARAPFPRILRVSRDRLSFFVIFFTALPPLERDGTGASRPGSIVRRSGHPLRHPKGVVGTGG